MKTTCAHPVSMWELIGKKKANGKAVILQNIPPPGVPALLLYRDCGHCSGCTVRRRMDLALRLKHEAYYYEHVWFVTLTYDDENLPEHGSLRADDMTLFVNKLRQQKLHRNKVKIRYFGVGEYGGTMGRAHYHMILFGPELADKELHYSKPDTRYHSPEFIQLMGKRPSFEYYKSETLLKAWDNKGHVQLTGVSTATMQYVSKFHIEKVSGYLAKYHYEVIDEHGEPHAVESENARISRNPGIGRRWIEEFWQDVYPKGYITIEGKKVKPPAYYDRWLEQNHPDIYTELKERRQASIDLEMHLDDRRNAVDACRNAQINLNKEKER